MRNSIGSAGFSPEYWRNGPIGMIAPGLTKSGNVSTGAVASTLSPPGLLVPVQKLRHEPEAAGRYTDWVVAPAAVTGVTMIAGPNKYWFPMPRVFGSFAKSMT